MNQIIRRGIKTSSVTNKNVKFYEQTKWKRKIFQYNAKKAGIKI